MFSSTSAGDHDGARLEILVPTAEDSPIAKFLVQKGSGIHHIAFTVADIESSLAFLKAKGVQLIDEVPRDGAHKTKIAFIHPKSTGGLLVELVQENL
jgi:methylmalonyl-CoA/ethylmalonyl-CoA epimerase